jgi:hypothetical protein
MKLIDFLHFLYKFHSILKGMGDKHFSDEKILESRELLVMFVLNLFKKKVEKEHRDLPVEEEPPIGVMGESTNDGSAAHAAGDGVEYNEDDDQEFMMGLMKAGTTIALPSQGLTLDSMMEDCKKSIEHEFISYIEYCKKINWKETLAKHGTEKYQKLLKDKALNEQKMNINPRYVRYLFDVIGWWRDTGYKLFPRLAVAALIVLAKATHNGYQERVFSIGTFLDSKQQKRRELRHYEMDVLQRINSGLMQEEEYWEEIQATDHDQNDKDILEKFFEITDKVQEQQAKNPPAESKEDGPPPAGEDDVISVASSATDSSEYDYLVPYVDIAASEDES